MFGYACTETETLMPMPIHLAHLLTRRLADVRKSGLLPWVRPDGKSQVTVEYHFGEPKRVDTILVSTQHAPEVGLEEIRAGVVEHVIHPVIPEQLLDDEVKIFINPTGRFVVGGPQGDSGVTGRKIIVDTYGGMGRHGGGCFSGKDPTKVDRTGAYGARWVAKHIVAAGLADRVEIQVAYAIGIAHPLSVFVETFGTGRLPDEEISQLVNDLFDLRPGALIRDFDLRRPIYQPIATYGHFGREDLDLPWEKLNRLEDLKSAAGVDTSVPTGI
jgi:S-adenosylmethionine synthetase